MRLPAQSGNPIRRNRLKMDPRLCGDDNIKNLRGSNGILFFEVNNVKNNLFLFTLLFLPVIACGWGTVYAS
jgi:hypothetical protein